MSWDDTLPRKAPCQFNILTVNTTKVWFVNMALKNMKHAWKGRNVSLFKGFKGSRWNCKPPHTIAQICTTFLLMLFIVCKYSKPESKLFCLNPNNVEQEKSLTHIVCYMWSVESRLISRCLLKTTKYRNYNLFSVIFYSNISFQNLSDLGKFCCLYSHS